MLYTAFSSFVCIRKEVSSTTIMINMFGRKMAICIGLLVISFNAFTQEKQLPRTFLWRISGNGLSKPSFLYGTIHLSDKRLFYFGDSLYHYLEQAEGFNMEIDADSLIGASIRSWTAKDKGRLLKSVMNKKDYETYAEKLSKKIGKPADKITTKDVWIAKNEKTAEAYKKGNMESFMDLYLYSLAKRQGKKVGGIEDLKDQLDIIDDLFDELDVAYLTQDKQDDKGVSMMERMKNIYLKQDLNAVAQLSEGPYNKKFKDIVLMRRNEKMARRMDSLARLRSSFFAVGVAHLPGDTGVIDLLQKRGFTVEPVFSSKKISPESYTYKSVELPWVTYTHELQLYKVEMPGLPQPVDMLKEIMDMQLYYDLAASKVYYTAVVNTAAGITNKDSVFTVMINRMASSGSLISKKNITKQNFEGRDVVLKTGTGELMRMNVFMTDGLVYMAMVAAKGSDISDNDKDVKRFLASFYMTPSLSVAKPYIQFKDTATAFSIKLPVEPTVTERKDTEGGDGEARVFAATDFSSGNSYSVTVRDTKVGNYIPSDSSYLALIKNNLSTIMKEDTSTTFFTYNDYPALRMNGSAKSENLYYNTLMLLRGNRSYFLMALTKKAGQNEGADSFFHSFQLTDYSVANWDRYSAPDHSFIAWLPAPVIDTDEAAVDTATVAEEEVKDAFISYDKTTGTGYNIQREHFSDYYWSESDSTFFKDAALAYKAEGDSLVSFKLLNLLNDKAADAQIEHGNSSVIKKMRLILHSDTLYKVITFTPRWLANNTNTNKFFNEFSITSAARPVTILTNKTNQLIADLTSADSATFAKASYYLYSAKLHKSNLQDFYPLLIKPLKDFYEDPYNANNKLVDAVAEVADSSTVDFVLQQYPLLENEPQKLQYQLLKLLAKMEQPYATNTLVKLFNSSITPQGNAVIFVPSLYNKLSLAKTLFPKFISFTKDTTAALQYAYLVTLLLDSNYISKQDVLPYFENFVQAAAQEKKKIKNNDDDYNYYLSNVLDLFGKINNAEANTLLQQYTTVNNLDVKYNALTWLINNKQPLPADAINKLASSNQFRTELHDTLKKANKIALFPVAQLKQSLFAASYVYSNASDDEDYPKAVDYLKEVTVTDKGKKQKFYLFKVTLQDEDASKYLGVAGPFSPNADKLTSTNEATGIFWDEKFSAKKIDEHFGKYMKQLEADNEEEQE